eukprot:2037290-Ditylum_brightwellii.AAC.1
MLDAENKYDKYTFTEDHSIHVEHDYNLEPSEKGAIYDNNVGKPSNIGTEFTTVRSKSLRFEE